MLKLAKAIRKVASTNKKSPLMKIAEELKTDKGEVYDKKPVPPLLAGKNKPQLGFDKEEDQTIVQPHSVQSYTKESPLFLLNKGKSQKEKKGFNIAVRNPTINKPYA